MAAVYLALGSNLGDRLQNLRDAAARLRAEVFQARVSRVYETEPWGVTAQPRFLNMVLAGETGLDPHALLNFAKGIERAMGRMPTLRYGPRIIDIDILLYDDLLIKTGRLEVPHPRLGERRFVLVPLAEIAPELRHPISGVSMRELLERLPDEKDVRVFDEFQ